MARKASSPSQRASRRRRTQGPGFGAPQPDPQLEGLAADAAEAFTADGRLLGIGRPQDWNAPGLAAHAAACLAFGWSGEVLVAVDAGGMADFAAFSLRRPGESSLEALERAAPDILPQAFGLRRQGRLEPCPASGRHWIQLYACDLPGDLLEDLGSRGGWAVVSAQWLAQACRSAAELAPAMADDPARGPDQPARPGRGRPRRPPRGRPGRKPLPRPEAPSEEDAGGLAASMIHGVTPRLALAVDGGGLKLRAVRGREAQAASPEPCGERGSAEPPQD